MNLNSINPNSQPLFPVQQNRVNNNPNHLSSTNNRVQQVANSTPFNTPFTSPNSHYNPSFPTVIHTSANPNLPNPSFPNVIPTSAHHSHFNPSFPFVVHVPANQGQPVSSFPTVVHVPPNSNPMQPVLRHRPLADQSANEKPTFVVRENR